MELSESSQPHRTVPNRTGIALTRLAVVTIAPETVRVPRLSCPEPTKRRAGSDREGDRAGSRDARTHHRPRLSLGRVPAWASAEPPPGGRLGDDPREAARAASISPIRSTAS